MIKKLRLYQIGFFIITFAFITLCVYMGITAIQKSMTLNLSFQTSPKVYCQLMIGTDVIFDNTNPTNSTIGNYITLSGNTLTFDKGKFETSFGTGSFDLKITNGTNTKSAILVEVENVSNETSSIINMSASQTFSITPTSSSMTISMTKVLPVSITKTGAVLSSGNIETTTNGSYYLNIEDNDELNATFTAQSPAYKDPVEITATTSKGEYSASGSITIPSQNLGTTNISINATAQPGNATIDYGTTTNYTSSETTTSVAIGSPYTTTLTATNGNIFDSVTVSGSPYTWTPNATDKRLGTLTVNVTGNFTINTSVRKPTLTITYTGDLVDPNKDLKGRTLELIIGTPGEDYSVGGHPFLWHLEISGYTSASSNTSAEVEVGGGVLLYSVLSNLISSKVYYISPSITKQNVAFDTKIIEREMTAGWEDNYLYFQMPAIDTTIEVDAPLGYFNWGH